MSISKIRENARVALKGKWGKGVCIIIAYIVFSLVIEFVAGFLSGLLGGNSMVEDLIALATAIIAVPVSFGITYAFIKLKRNEEVKAFDFIGLGFSNFGRAWKIELRQFLKIILPIIAMICSVILFTIPITYYSIEANAATAPVWVAIIFFVGMILYAASFIWAILRILLYALTTYVAYDNPNMSSLEVVNESAKMMKGNRGKFVLLGLSFIGWAFLAIFSFGIGCLWLMPYVAVAEACFYDYLLDKKQNSEQEGNAEAIKEM